MRIYRLLLILLLSLSALPAAACSICVFAMFDAWLPPIPLWCLLALVWYVGAAVLATRFDQRLPGIPPLGYAITFALGSIFIGMGILGPLCILPFAIPAIVACARSLNRKNDPSPIQCALHCFGSVMVVITLAVAGISGYLRYNETDAQFIARWGSSGPTSVAMKRLREREPESLADYQYIVQHGSGRNVVEASARIAAIAESAEDRQGKIHRIN